MMDLRQGDCLGKLKLLELFGGIGACSKALELVKRHLLHTTQENDIVADFFLGSGTSCVAAKELDRKYIGFEIDKEYFNIAKNRLNGITAGGQISIFTDTNQLEAGFD